MLPELLAARDVEQKAMFDSSLEVAYHLQPIELQTSARIPWKVPHLVGECRESIVLVIQKYVMVIYRPFELILLHPLAITIIISAAAKYRVA